MSEPPEEDPQQPPPEGEPQHERPVADLIQALKQGESSQQIQATLLEVAAAYWSAPLPPPDILAEYNKAYPGCAQEIVDMARTQSAHRQSVEKTVIDGDVKRASRGQIFGFIVAMTIVLVGGALLWHGRSVTGLITLVGGMTGLIGVFVYARRREDKELAEKREALAIPPPPQA